MNPVPAVTTTGLPFLSVVASTAPGLATAGTAAGVALEHRATHLALHSPAAPGHSPDATPPLTLCLQPARGRSSTPIGDVDCLTCLTTSTRYLTWPAFEGAQP